jgi:hypothetical protein
LDFADVYIRDNPADSGGVPFIGDFYSDSDIVVRSDDDLVFSHGPATPSALNYIYVRVNNRGPATARNLRVSVRAVPFVGTEFIHPDDWTTVDAAHIQPTAIIEAAPELPPGETMMARFSLSAEQTDVLSTWKSDGYHPCLLAEVQCDNDYATGVGVHTWENNNLAQRNITIAEVAAGAPMPFPFIAGHRSNRETQMQIVVDRRRLPQHVELILDPWDSRPHFPAVEPQQTLARPFITLLDRSRFAVSMCGCDGVLTLQAGSSFECGQPQEEELQLEGAVLREHNGRRVVVIQEQRATITVPKRPGQMRQMSLTFRTPPDARVGEQYEVHITQRNARYQTVGGAALLVRVASSA